MKFFIDTANVEEIRKAAELGMADGVTTNPSLVARESGSFRDIIAEISSLITGPVSAEVIATESDLMVREARNLAAIGPNVVVKIPMTAEGLKAVKILSEEGIKTNVTLVFSALQALMAAKAGASYVSPFVGRLDDISHEGMLLVEQIRTIFVNYSFDTEIIVASVRSPQHVLESALAGADIATIPYGVLARLMAHPLTDIGLEAFLKDFEEAGK